VICFGLVGLELASVMAMKSRILRELFPGRRLGGFLSGLLYIGATLTLLVAVSKNDISVLKELFRPWATWPAALGQLDRCTLCIPVEHVDRRNWLRLLGGSARIPFVAGLDSYMPSWLGKIHPKYARRMPR